MKKVVISQSNYIPWRGYFDLIASADEFIIYDDMQYTKNVWRNRNKIKTPQGEQWLTIPVRQERLAQKIKDTKINKKNWAMKHLKSIVANYSRAPHFRQVMSWLEPLYIGKDYTHLSCVNRSFIEAVCKYLNINTVIRGSNDFDLIEGKTDRLVDLCKQLGADVYISAPAAKNYIEEDKFKDGNLELVWFDYGDYPEYPQLWGNFINQVTVLDLLFNCGEGSAQYMKCGKDLTKAQVTANI